MREMKLDHEFRSNGAEDWLQPACNRFQNGLLAIYWSSFLWMKYKKRRLSVLSFCRSTSPGYWDSIMDNNRWRFVFLLSPSMWAMPRMLSSSSWLSDAWFTCKSCCTSGCRVGLLRLRFRRFRIQKTRPNNIKVPIAP